VLRHCHNVAADFVWTRTTKQKNEFYFRAEGSCAGPLWQVESFLVIHPSATMARDNKEVPEDAPRPRLCHIVKRDDFNGYGFNLHAQKARPGQGSIL
jgi:hypothetical protein